MAELKPLKTRIINKHATAAVWNSTNFTPLQGEIVVYDPGYDSKDGKTYTRERMKIGDGTHNIQELPFADDVMEGTLSTFPTKGETGKIYVDTATNKSYRWSGSKYVEISASLALGETASTAYRGDRGKEAYEHSKATGNVHNLPVASTTQDGLMAASDKVELAKKADLSTFDGSYYLGSLGGKTLNEFRTAIDTWLATNSKIMGASAQFGASEDWVDIWNSNDSTATISGESTWSLTVTSRDNNSSYVQLRFSRYKDKLVYYSCKYNGVWEDVYKVAFEDDVDKKLDKKADIENGILNGAVLSTATSMVGHEYNILLHSYITGRYTFTESGTGLLGEDGLFKLTNGRVQPAYSSDGIDPDNPYVLLIEGLPSDHTQRGGFFGWTCRYWAPMRFTVEGYDDKYRDGWTMLANYSENTDSSVGANFIIPFFNSNPELSLAGAYTKLRITVYESVTGNHVGANGFRKWGISELFFCHPEADGTKVYGYADVDMVDGKHASDFYQKGVDTTFDGNITGKSGKVDLQTANIDVYRPVWIDDTTKSGKPNYNNNFTYNPAQGDLKVNKINGADASKLTYLNSVTSDIQTQLNAKADKSEIPNISEITNDEIDEICNSTIYAANEVLL